VFAHGVGGIGLLVFAAIQGVGGIGLLVFAMVWAASGCSCSLTKGFGGIGLLVFAPCGRHRAARIGRKPRCRAASELLVFASVTWVAKAFRPTALVKTSNTKTTYN